MAIHVYPVFEYRVEDDAPVPTGKWTVKEDGGERLADYEYRDAVDAANALALEKDACVHIHAAFSLD